MKYLIAPTQQIGEYWAKNMKLLKTQYRIISYIEQLAGMIFTKKDDILYIEGEQFEFAELNNYEHYKQLIEYLQGRIR